MQTFFWLSAFFFVFQTGVWSAPQFQQALPGATFQFPRDHGAHPRFATEWWYYTGHLRASDGRNFGFQLTWFRTAIAPHIARQSKWAARDVMFAHFAISDLTNRRFFFSDTIGRANLGLNGAQSNVPNPRIWCGDWVLQFSGKSGQTQTLRASAQSDAPATRGQKFALRLRVSSLKPPVIQGQNGVSQKSAGKGRASHYYSYTRLQSAGEIQIGDQKLAVTGQSWLDREWGSSQLAPNQTGWDWFSLQLSDGRELMLYQLRLKNGGIEPFSSGSLVEKDGRKRHLKRADFRLTPLSERWRSPQTKAVYPTSWRIEVPSARLNLEVRAVFPEQELVPVRSGQNLSYWEGAVEARGRGISGRGYLEMTGYAQPFNATF